jgi:hypothetical protein
MAKSAALDILLRIRLHLGNFRKIGTHPECFSINGSGTENESARPTDIRDRAMKKTVAEPYRDIDIRAVLNLLYYKSS